MKMVDALKLGCYNCQLTENSNRVTKHICLKFSFDMHDAQNC